MPGELEKIQKEQTSVFSSAAVYEKGMEIATTLSKTDLVPSTYKGKPGNCLIALDVARQVRNSPLVVMQNLHIILGKPSWSATYIAGTIRSRYKKIDVKTTGEGMQRGCQVIAYDEAGNVIAEGTRVTMEMAKAEGWIDKKDSKWKTMPDLMLQYRANAFFGRIFCPDVLIGIQSEYEVQDISRVVDDADVVDPFVEDNKEKPPEPPQKAAVEPEIVDAEVIEEPAAQEETKPEESNLFDQDNNCTKCGTVVSTKVKDYCIEKGNPILCYPCQRG